ncbi:hypothetical protein TRFO_09551 [Tritrichomonas foetus]|uniref:USP domain-containing protein n=1 Tax=Tritrichomonas foetus TaxID=1144522 RepID=A0A1J4JF19_9EUKA|nr:hypothetical protein TRFO_09551 [Tritrichomonas foetus]|eukprot:OHS97273.1 hypothetical protein TRFO_09551 [Tritrichomonas foetus]
MCFEIKLKSRIISNKLFKNSQKDRIMHPDEDFSQWSQHLQKSVTNPANIGYYYQDLSSMLISISQTDFLPPTLTKFTHQFLDDFPIKIVLPIIERAPSNESHFSILKDFIRLFAQFSLYGILRLDRNAILVGVYLLEAEQKNFFKSTFALNNLFYSVLCHEYLKWNTVQIIIDILTDEIQSLELLGYLVRIFSILSNFIPNFNEDEILFIVKEALSKTIKYDNNPKMISIVMESVRYRITKQSIAESFISMFLPFISPFLQSDNLEHRIYSFKEINSIIEDEKTSILYHFPVSQFFMEPANLISLTEMKFHTEISDFIANIFSILSKNGNLEDDIIYKIWHNYEFLSEKDKSKFFDMFLHLTHFAEDQKIETIIHCILEDNINKYSLSWYDQIDSLTKILSRKNAKKSVELIRNVLWELSFSGDINDSNVQRARESLLKAIIIVKPSEDDLSKLIELFKTNQDDFIYLLLNELIKIDEFDLKKYPNIKIDFNEMFDQTILQILMSESPNELMYEFLTTICKQSEYCLSNKQIEKIFQLQNKTPDFFSILAKLADCQSLDESKLENVLPMIDENLINIDFYRFIKLIMKNSNDTYENIKSLPLKHEKVLWQFSITNSPIREKIANLLVKLYCLNDGNELEDDEMVNSFLSNWQSYFVSHRDTEPEVINYLLELLKLFIDMIEYSTIRDPYINPLHVYYEFPNIEVFIKIENASLKITVPYDARIGWVVEYVASDRKIDMNSFALYHKGIYQKRTIKIQKLIPEPSSIYFVNLEARPISIKSTKKFHYNYQYHHRTSLPSILILSRPWAYDIYQLMEQNNLHAYNLTNLLPLLPYAPDFSKDEVKFNLEEAFDPTKVLTFIYNLNTIIIQNQIENLHVKYHLIDYLYSVSDKLFQEMNINNLNVVFTAMILFVKKIDFVHDIQLKSNLFVLMVKGMIFCCHPIYFNFFSNQVISYLNNCQLKAKIPFPENFINIFQNILFHHSIEYRVNAVMLFDQLSIPLSVFLQIFESMGEINDIMNSLTAEFLDTLNRHFFDIRDIENSEKISSLLLSLIERAHGSILSMILNIVLKLINEGLVDNEQKPWLLHFLIDHFLVFDFDEHDRISFISAAKCIAALSDVTDSYGNLILKGRLMHINSLNNSPYSVFNINGENCAISNLNKVGLKNLGMTCYLNSTLQQFYALKPLRYAVMSYSGENMLLTELAHLFFLMKYAKTKFIIPTFLIEQWKIGKNESLNPRVQQDAAEFIQNVIMFLESGELSNAMVENLLTGVESHYFSGIDVDYTRENTEPFTTIELAVQDFNDLNASLAHFSNPECLTNENQLNVDNIGRFDAKMITKVKKTPPVLIIHLKRFNYTCGTQNRKKINHIFQVYNEIDISPICTGVDPDKVHYHLIGVIVHKGMAESGHYISYVKKKKSGVWICFDDENITQISEADVIEQSSGNDGKDSSGYILFYERPNEVSFEKPAIPTKIEQEINTINDETRRSKLLCTEGFFTLMNLLSLNPSMDYLEICTQYIISTLPYCQCASESPQMFVSLVRKLKHSNYYVRNFIDYWLHCDNQLISKALFFCPHNSVRSGIADVIICCFKKPQKIKIIEKSISKRNNQNQEQDKEQNQKDASSNTRETTSEANNENDQIDNKYDSTNDSQNNNNNNNTNNDQNAKNEDENANNEDDKPHDNTDSSVFDPQDRDLYDTNSTYPVLIVSNLFDLVEFCLFNYRQIDSLFKVLYKLHKYYDSVKQFVVENQWPQKLCEIFSTGMNVYLTINPGILQSYVYKGIDLTHYLRLIVNLDLIKNNNTEVAQPILNEQFFSNILQSQTEPSAIAEFINAYFSVDSFKKFIQANASSFVPYRIVSIIFHLIPDQATRLLFELPLKNEDRQINTFDIVTILIAIVSEYEEMGSFVAIAANLWIPCFLYDDNIDTRSNCVSLCAYIAPTDLFDENIFEIDTPDDLVIPHVSRYSRKADDEIIEYCKYFLNILFLSENILSEKIVNDGKNANNFGVDEERSEQFIRLVKTLLQVVPEKMTNYSPIISLFSTLTTSLSDVFNPQMCDLINLIHLYHMPIEINTLLIPFQEGMIDVNDSFYRTLTTFLHSFVGILKDIISRKERNLKTYENQVKSEGENDNQHNKIIPDWFYNTYLNIIVIHKFGALVKVEKYVLEGLEVLIHEDKNLVLEILEIKFDEYIERNFYMLCRLIEKLEVTRPILDQLPKYLELLVRSGMDVNVETKRTIKCSEPKKLSSTAKCDLFNRFKFNEEVTQILCELPTE